MSSSELAAIWAFLASHRESPKGGNPPDADVPADGVPSFVLEWWKNGAPDGVKLGTPMSLFVL
jgi:hypothetical protein